jgi:hypothetical protein
MSSFDLTRPSTAPSPSDTLQNRSNTGVVSSMRTGLEPNKFTDMFPPTKTTTESNKSDNWLGYKDESSEEDEPPLRGIQKIEPAVTTLVKKTPIVSVQETLPTVSEPPKKSVLDDLLEDDRRVLTEKTALTPTVVSNTTKQDFWLDERTSSTKRPATTGLPKPSLFTDTQQIKSSTKPLFHTKNDFGIFF